MENLPGFENLLGFASNYVLSEYIGTYRLIDFLEGDPRPKFQIPRPKRGSRIFEAVLQGEAFILKRHCEELTCPTGREARSNLKAQELVILFLKGKIER